MKAVLFVVLFLINIIQARTLGNTGKQEREIIEEELSRSVRDLIYWNRVYNSLKGTSNDERKRSMYQCQVYNYLYKTNKINSSSDLHERCRRRTARRSGAIVNSR